MQNEIVNEYTAYAKKYAVRYMDDKWNNKAQVRVKITRWQDAVKDLHNLKSIDDPRWYHMYQLKAGMIRSCVTHLPGCWLMHHMPKTYTIIRLRYEV
jgi:hypothetical protein